MNRSHRFSASVNLAISSVGWALAPVFIRDLSAVYEPHTQNFLRYLSAVVPLLFISIIWFRPGLRDALRAWRGMLGIALLNVAQQYTWAVGCAGSTATTAQLVSKLSIVFVVVLGFILYHEERAVIRSPWYLVGTLLSFAGLAAVIASDRASLIPVMNWPMAMLLATAVFWGGYTVWAKHLVGSLHPIPMFTVLSAYTTVGCGLFALTLGEPDALFTAGMKPTSIAIVSGLIPIALAHPTFFYAQKHLGSAFCTSVALLNPLVTYAIALWIWPDEHMVPHQWAGAALLLAGTLMVTRAGKRMSSSQKTVPSYVE